jgi:cell division protein FtsN
MTSRTDRRPAHAALAKRRAAPSRKSGIGGTLLGVFIGMALGLALAAGAAFYLTKGSNPYLAADPAREPARDAAREPARPGRVEAGANEKPRFDFYKILPGAEEPRLQSRAGERAAPDKTAAERAASPDKAIARLDDHAASPAADGKYKSGERLWLQAGSFASEADAEGLKARLAFAGWEATVQPAMLPDKGVRYRVRLGPYDNTEELTRMKVELGKRGFDVAVIRN